MIGALYGRHPCLAQPPFKVDKDVWHTCQAKLSRGADFPTPKLGVKLWIEPRKKNWSKSSAKSSKALASLWLPTTKANKLAKIALEGKPCASIADHLTGMTVLTYSEDPVAAAKVAQTYAKENDKLVILGGAMGENVLDVAGVKAVSEMPSREELIASIVGAIGAPAANIAGAVGAPASNIASILSTIEEKAA